VILSPYQYGALLLVLPTFKGVENIFTLFPDCDIAQL